MTQWMELRHGRGWIAGAGWIALGASSIFASGCTTTVADLKAGSKPNQQVAKSGAKSNSLAGRNSKSAKQIAAKKAPGKTRLSDLDDGARSRMIAQVEARKATTTAPTAQPQQAAPTQPAPQVAAAPTMTPQNSGSGAASRAPEYAVAGQRRTSAQGEIRQREATAAVADSRVASGSIAQTAAADRPAAAPAVAKRASKSASQGRPRITPKANTQWQPENGGDATIASSHERQRADLLMQRAHAMLSSGYREEALRLASIAADLETSQQAIYRRGEERPSEFIVKLQPVDGTQVASAQVASVETHPEAKSAKTGGLDQGPIISAKPRSATGIARANAGRTTPKSRLEAGRGPLVGEPTVPIAAAPRFSQGDRENLRAAANAGQLDVPPTPKTRNADADAASTDIAATETPEASSGEKDTAVASATRVEDTAEKAASPQALASASKQAKLAPFITAAAPAPSDVELDPLADSDTAGTSSSPASQLTIASLVGLLTGVAGMIGLGWWRRQEKRHYAAAKKAPELRIQEPDEEPAQLRRAA